METLTAASPTPLGLLLTTSAIASSEERTMHQMIKDAVATGDLSEFKAMVEAKKLPIQCIDAQNGWPILFYAIKYNQNDIMTHLLERGHEAENCSTDFAGNTALIIASESKNEKAIAVYAALYPHIVNAVNQMGQNALMIAASKGLTKGISFLLDLGADTSAVDEDGSTALHYAMSYGHAEASVLLIELGGVSMHIKNNKGFTAHDYAYSADLLF
ncbi:ankyrin repeat-containing domain protein [Chytriomyces cf. hyalinus JEL632]|nr:ankyrin repeat-containing domain protein [Chytriomyces cf. hyalinus JEL632]